MALILNSRSCIIYFIFRNNPVFLNMVGRQPGEGDSRTGWKRGERRRGGERGVGSEVINRCQ